MPTIVVLDGVAHFAHPDKDGETFCGESYTHDTADRIVSGARYADDLMAQVVTEEDADVCDECVARSEEWAAP